MFLITNNPINAKICNTPNINIIDVSIISK